MNWGVAYDVVLNSMNPLSRRDFLSSAVGATAGLSLPISFDWNEEQSASRVKVPQSLPE